jgi:hypothetical protein
MKRADVIVEVSFCRVIIIGDPHDPEKRGFLFGNDIEPGV